jgi:hypothetical protein
VIRCSPTSRGEKASSFPLVDRTGATQLRTPLCHSTCTPLTCLMTAAYQPESIVVF